MWEQAWLNYSNKKIHDKHLKMLTTLYVDKVLLEDVKITNCVKELDRLLEANEGEQLKLTDDPSIAGIVLKTTLNTYLGLEGYHLRYDNGFIVEGHTTTGILYGVFRLIECLRLNQSIKQLDIESVPKNPLRMINHWDNMDGSIERGYSGNSFFFENNQIIINQRTVDYARLLASIGINSVVINNVNVKDKATYLITDEYLDDLNQLSTILYGYGVSLYISINYASPMEIGGLASADPFDEDVKTWWKEQSRYVFEGLTNFGGYLVKADSEGREGPFTYGRTQADGANMLAQAVAPYGGKIIWRCFVYNCQQDWRDLKTDRAKAGYEAFKPLDGEFLENVILQIKNGPMDFQVREPVSPLFGALKHTNQMLEVQAAQEYTGQQIHVCYLVPMWKEILDFQTYHYEAGRVKDIISGTSSKALKGGMAAVINTGNDDNWTGHDLAGANFYGFGKLAWDPDLSSKEIAEAFSLLTFGHEEAMKVVSKILLDSWEVYESYTTPLGLGWMVNVSHHYGPSPEGYEYDRWGTYHRADHTAIGVDRTSTGTNYTNQYHEINRKTYESMETCPESLLLFFHRIPYKHILSDQRTLIQYMYDAHFDGAKRVRTMKEDFIGIKGHIDDKIYYRVLERFDKQIDHSELWRDVINSYFYRKSGIPDEKHRQIF